MVISTWGGDKKSSGCFAEKWQGWAILPTDPTTWPVESWIRTSRRSIKWQTCSWWPGTRYLKENKIIKRNSKEKINSYSRMSSTDWCDKWNSWEESHSMERWSSVQRDCREVLPRVFLDERLLPAEEDWKSIKENTKEDKNKFTHVRHCHYVFAKIS